MGWIVYQLYQLIVGAVFVVCAPFVVVFLLFRPSFRKGFSQRLGIYRELKKKEPGKRRIWLHAASVGEVQAAQLILGELRVLFPAGDFVLSTMTSMGRTVARKNLASDVCCFLAPLDVPFVTDRALKSIEPDLYICLETELWPLLLEKLSRRGCKVGLANGRLSERSYGRYIRGRWFLKRVLAHFDKMAMISPLNRDRYLGLGAEPEKIEVLGNIKFDQVLPSEHKEIAQKYRMIADCHGGQNILICGSTHGGEETLLLSLYQQLIREGEWLFLLAPRHIERIDSIIRLFDEQNLDYDRLSRLKSGQKRRTSLILVDTMGELFHLYSMANFVFCGGSLVPKGGHNIMEAAIWGKVVFYGPDMKDFLDATELLESAGAGFPVRNIAEMKEKILYLGKHPDEYQKICRQASDVARSQEGAAGRQAAMFADLLK